MADIHPYPFLRHLRGAPTTYMCERRSACLMPNGLRMSRQLVRARRVRRCSFG